MDNTTAISYINNMGGIASLKCDKLAKRNLVPVYEKGLVVKCIAYTW